MVVEDPDEEGRRKILAENLRRVALEEDGNLICYLIVSLPPDFVGCRSNIISETDLLVAHRGVETVAREDVMEAFDKEKFRNNDKQLRRSTINKELGKMLDPKDAFSDGK